MSKYRFRQSRSGEGAILTRFSHLGPSALPVALGELLAGRVLLVAADRAPEKAEPLREGLWLLREPEAARFVAGLEDSPKQGLVWAVVDQVPDEEALSRCIPEPQRPWDHERLGARVYAQWGSRFAHEGLWLREDDDRRRWLEAALLRILEPAGHALPNGDVGLVLDMPPDATFEAELVARGRGDSFRLRRDFADRGLYREWWIERGEWKGEETRRPPRRSAPLRERLVQGAATAGIFLLSFPVSAFVFLVLLTTRLTDASSTSGRAAEKG